MAAKHDVAPYKGHVAVYTTGFVVAVALFGATTALVWSGKPTGWEYTWFTALNGWSEGWYRAMTIITFFGSTWAAAGSVITAFALRFYRLAWRLAFSIIGAYGVAYLAKHFIGRERPAELITQVHARVAESGMGFPSGHATISTVIALTLVPYLPWKLRWLLPVGIAAAVVSRLYLGVHLPLDVIGGVALGTAVVCFVRILPQSLRVLLRID